MNPDVVTIVGGGWSVANVLPRKLLGYVIAINDSALHLPPPQHWDACLSMDRLWTEHRLTRVLIAAMGMPKQPEIYLRRSAVQNIAPGLLRKYPWVFIFDCDHEETEPSATPLELNGTSSGMCALNLAWQLAPKTVYLLGFDMCRRSDGRAYWYPPYEWSHGEGGTGNKTYANWAKQFGPLAAAFKRIGCQVFNVSPHSKIDIWPKLPATEYT